ncbi:hypothetical protein ACFQX6_54370 [Streptosporangium lutulentum]
MASVRVERTESGGFVARNGRGAEVAMGGGDEQGCSPPWNCCSRRWAVATSSPWSR